MHPTPTRYLGITAPTATPLKLIQRRALPLSPCFYGLARVTHGLPRRAACMGTLDAHGHGTDVRDVFHTCTGHTRTSVATLPLDPRSHGTVLSKARV